MSRDYQRQIFCWRALQARAKLWFKRFDVLQIHSQPGFILDQSITAQPSKQTLCVSCTFQCHDACCLQAIPVLVHHPRLLTISLCLVGLNELEELGLRYRVVKNRLRSLLASTLIAVGHPSLCRNTFAVSDNICSTATTSWPCTYRQIQSSTRPINGLKSLKQFESYSCRLLSMALTSQRQTLIMNRSSTAMLITERSLAPFDALTRMTRIAHPALSLLTAAAYPAFVGTMEYNGARTVFMRADARRSPSGEEPRTISECFHHRSCLLTRLLTT